MKEDIDLVFSGSGTLFPCHLGALASLQRDGKKVRRVAGTSGGALVAAAVAHGMSVARAMELVEGLLKKEILDSQMVWWNPLGFLNGYGIHKGDKIHAALRKVFPGRMNEADLTWGCFVVDIGTKLPVWINSRAHGHLHTADVVMASMSIPLFFRMRTIRNMPGEYVDGGASINFGMSVWDDVPERRTIGVRFKAGKPKRKKIANFVGYIGALVALLVDNANRGHVSRKRWASVINIESAGDGMNFDLDKGDIEKLFLEGSNSAGKFLHREIANDTARRGS
jgi:NTE family protein